MLNMMLAVGARIEDERGSRGTIRYVGPVATSKDPTAVYYGVEWDDWGRGLNDGSVTLATGERVVYFDGPAPSAQQFKCSFLKASKVHALERATLAQRLRERYSDAAPDAAVATLGGRLQRDVVITGQVGTTLGSQKPIELVGVEKLRRRQTLATIEKISLASCQIAALGVETRGQLGALVPQITELDLSGNLLDSWATVLELLEELPLLDTLILSGNRLRYDVSAAIVERRVPQLKRLVLNQTLMDWATLTTLLGRHFPSLQELYVAGNGIRDADLETVDFSARVDGQSHDWLASLEVVDLSDNALRSWRGLQTLLGSFTCNLKQLVLNNNRISTLSAASDHVAPPASFQALTTLSLNDNLIDSWTSIDALNGMPSLAALRLLRNPLTAQLGAGEARMIIVARAAYLKVFNASVVGIKERSDAEQMYLKRILYELAAVGDAAVVQRTAILASHPRYHALCELYPDMVASITAALSGGGSGGAPGGPSTLGSTLIQVKIVPMSMNATTFDPLVKKMPQTMKVSQLKTLIEKKFGVPSRDQLLSFRADAKSMPLPLDGDDGDLGYFGLQDGVEILVNDA
ncbi:hypothetical protein ATCC90586_004835 [Pythium insidiosum]|nr:hypothetical protein ATCC90586_004835 [Pythium insidiosum]